MNAQALIGDGSQEQFEVLIASIIDSDEGTEASGVFVVEV